MRSVERGVEWLRPLVDSKAWDYCVVWKLGDDPSRFIQWLGCCCSGGVDVRVKEEKVEQPLTQICRDSYFEHPIRSKACEALALFPFSMELYSGVHGEVVVSKQPRWIIHDKCDHLTGTKVLIPVFGGLIELSTAKHIPQNENVIRLVMGEFVGVQLLNLIPEPMAIPQLPHGGFSTMFDSKSEEEYLKPPTRNFQSKNLVTERKRRNRIRDGLFALRALVPKITKMDKGAILGDAAEYIVELQNEVKKVEDELKELEVEEKWRKSEKVFSGFAILQVEVKQMGKREFMIKALCEQREGGFGRMMEAMDSLHLQVVDANVTTSHGKVLNILQVEANKHVSPNKLRNNLINFMEAAM